MFEHVWAFIIPAIIVTLIVRYFIDKEYSEYDLEHDSFNFYNFIKGIK